MLHKLLTTALSIHPERPIIESDGIWTTAMDLERLGSRLASGLAAAGLEEGDRVAMLLPNCIEAVACYLACFRMQFVAVPLDYRHHPVQVGYALGHSGASILIVHRDRLRELEDAGTLAGMPRVVVVGQGDTTLGRRTFEALLGAERILNTRVPDEDSPAVMIYTSGSTSRPKGVLLSHGTLSEGVRKYLTRVTLDRDDVALIASPISRPMALRSQLLPVLWAGGRVCLLRRFDVAAYVEALRRPPAKTFLTLLPAALGQLVTDPGFPSCDFSGLRLCLAGGDHVPTRLHEQFEKVTGIAVTEQCGATETGAYAMNPPFGRKKPGSVGLPAPGSQVTVVDEHGEDLPTGKTGEIRVGGCGIMDGYWNDSALTRKTLQKGWVRTGDLGRFDEDGYLWFMGRIKDVIVRGGSNVAPLEVEAALSQHPAVLESCVIGVPDPDWGEAVHAHVIPAPGTTPDPRDLQAFLGTRIADYMVPSEIHLISEMPLKGSGKIDRELLRMRAIIAPLIDRVPFFQNASNDFLRDILPRLDARDVSRGEILVHEGDVGDEMFFLTKGQVEVLGGHPPQRLTVLREGEFFGEVAILRDVPRTATVRALVDGEVYALRRDAVLDLAHSHPDFARHLEKAGERYTSPNAVG